MDEFEQREDESLASYALRRRNLPVDHPAHLTSAEYQRFVNSFITSVERQQALNREALRRAGLSDARL